jgi:diguanylate cyclase (GGDEF)-like protein/PAS domain S-box-containing protein
MLYAKKQIQVGGDARHAGAKSNQRAAPSPVAGDFILRRLMRPLVVMLLLLAMGVVALLWNQQEQRLQETLTQRFAGTPHGLRLAQAQQLAVMSAVLERIAADRELHEALRNRDRGWLLSANRELLSELREKYGISHFYFHDKDRYNILRVQFPEKVGGRIDRHTMLEAERTGRTTGGLELGSFGILTLRVVEPVFSLGELIGYVELGKEIDDILKGLHRPDDVEMAITLHKERLKREAWEAGTKLTGRDFSWNDLPDDVLAYTSLWPMPAGFLKDYLADHDPGHSNVEAKMRGRVWRGMTAPLRDASGEDVGHLTVMLDITAQKAVFRQNLIVFVGLSSVAVGLLIVFLQDLLRKTDAHLLAQQTRLQLTEARQQAIFDTVIDGIVMIDERGRIELVNPAFQDIFGYRFDEVRGRNVSMLMPEPDRSAHDGYLRHYLGSGEAKIVGIGREVVGQRKDGSVFPMDLAVSETLIDGRRLFTGLVRDITARKQAEADLIESLQLQREYQHHACVDVLTGLHNRRWLDEAFARQIARCAREGQALGLIMLDADHFKHYNDTQGHFGGDCALRALGKVIADNIRPNDLAARYGGEEFAILLPGSSVASTLTIAERLRAAVEKTAILNPDGVPLPSITLSLGLSEMKPGDTLETLIASADAALYRAKQKGRNCVST